MTLARCTVCSRHVRASETTCPFCRARRATPLAVGAIVAAALGASACGASGPPPSPSTGDAEMRAAYERCKTVTKSEWAEGTCWRAFLAHYDSRAPNPMSDYAGGRLRTILDNAGERANVYGGPPPLPKKVEAGDGGAGR